MKRINYYYYIEMQRTYNIEFQLNVSKFQDTKKTPEKAVLLINLFFTYYE